MKILLKLLYIYIIIPLLSIGLTFFYSKNNLISWPTLFFVFVIFLPLFSFGLKIFCKFMVNKFSIKWVILEEVNRISEKTKMNNLDILWSSFNNVFGNKTNVIFEYSIMKDEDETKIHQLIDPKFISYYYLFPKNEKQLVNIIKENFSDNIKDEIEKGNSFLYEQIIKKFNYNLRLFQSEINFCFNVFNEESTKNLSGNYNVNFYDFIYIVHIVLELMNLNNINDFGTFVNIFLAKNIKSNIGLQGFNKAKEKQEEKEYKFPSWLTLGDSIALNQTKLGLPTKLSMWKYHENIIDDFLINKIKHIYEYGTKVLNKNEFEISRFSSRELGEELTFFDYEFATKKIDEVISDYDLNIKYLEDNLVNFKIKEHKDYIKSKLYKYEVWEKRNHIDSEFEKEKSRWIYEFLRQENLNMTKDLFRMLLYSELDDSNDNQKRNNLIFNKYEKFFINSLLGHGDIGGDKERHKVIFLGLFLKYLNIDESSLKKKLLKNKDVLLNLYNKYKKVIVYDEYNDRIYSGGLDFNSIDLEIYLNNEDLFFCKIKESLKNTLFKITSDNEKRKISIIKEKCEISDEDVKNIFNNFFKREDNIDFFITCNEEK